MDKKTLELLQEIASILEGAMANMAKINERIDNLQEALSHPHYQMQSGHVEDNSAPEQD